MTMEEDRLIERAARAIAISDSCYTYERLGIISQWHTRRAEAALRAAGLLDAHLSPETDAKVEG